MPTLLPGVAGVEAVQAITSQAARVLDIDAARVFTSSTGVIGEPLPHDRITAKLEELVANLSTDAIAMAGRAIMTTDTFPKGAGKTVEIDGKPVNIAGIAKGSGMIAPDMATMLSYIFTDAQVPPARLQSMLEKSVNRQLQLHHRRQRHLDLRQPCAGRDRCRPASPSAH